MTWLDLLGWAGSALLIYSLLQPRVLRLRVLNCVACLVLVAFNALIGVWRMVAMNVVLVGINVFFIRRLLADRHDDTAFTVVEVDSGDEYLRHVLRVHSRDISRFQPDFAWSEGAGTRSAYLVLRGDETVGVVLLRDAGGGVAQVELDYVTARFRDFAPGEFVWRRADQLTNEGFVKVVTPPRMVAPYYDKLGLGFRREGDSFVLDL
jgi:hypothetical protein